MIGAALFVIGCAVLLGLIKSCSPERHERSIHRHVKRRQDV